MGEVDGLDVRPNYHKAETKYDWRAQNAFFPRDAIYDLLLTPNRRNLLT